MDSFSDYTVYVDESGGHDMAKVDPEFPLFVLSFCIFRKCDYVESIVPALQRIKHQHFGHDMVVMHEREIRKAEGQFAFLTDAGHRNDFMNDLNRWVTESQFGIIAIVVRKEKLAIAPRAPHNPYHFAMQLGLERVAKYLHRHGQAGRVTHLVFESRGKKEDDELEAEFKRVCDGWNYRSECFNFRIVIAHKRVNSTGLQLADLTARPIGRHVMNPSQRNRAFEIIATKLDRGPGGKVEGYGLKCFP